MLFMGYPSPQIYIPDENKLWEVILLNLKPETSTKLDPHREAKKPTMFKVSVFIVRWPGLRTMRQQGFVWRRRSSVGGSSIS